MILYNSITSYQKCHHWIPFLQWKLRNSYPSIRLRPFDFGLLPRPIFQPNFRILFSRAFARDQVNRGQPRPPKISFPEILFFFFYIVFNHVQKNRISKNLYFLGSFQIYGGRRYIFLVQRRHFLLFHPSFQRSRETKMLRTIKSSSIFIPIERMVSCSGSKKQ